MWKTLPAPKDGISTLRFSKNNFLLVTCWDGSVSVATPNANAFSYRVDLPELLLAGAWDRAGEKVYVGGAAKRATIVDIPSKTVWDVGGDHQKPLSCLAVSDKVSAVLSGSYDGSLQIIDPRSDQGVFYPIGGKVLDLDLHENTIATALSGQTISLFDIRRLSRPLSTRKMHYNHPLRSIRISPSGKVFAVSTLCSRVSLEFLEPTQRDKCLSFKSNTVKVPASDPSKTTKQEYPINALAFHPKEPILATGGSDPSVQVWDYSAQKKVASHTSFPYSVTNLDISSDGGLLAVGMHDDAFRQSSFLASRRQPSAVMILQGVKGELARENPQ